MEGWVYEIPDEMDLDLICESGQCFRMARGNWLGEGSFRLITGEKVLYLRPLSGSRYEASAPPGQWEEIWKPYLDLGFCYGQARRMGGRGNAFFQAAFESGEGLRILRQDPWEMVVTFILSQRKSIPAIRRNVEDLCSSYGRSLDTPYEKVYAFPSAREMEGVGEEEFRQLGLGYRAPYVVDAVRQVGQGMLDLSALEDLPDEQVVERLMQVKGVGIKVASCVALFGYGRKSCAPVDVWIERAIREECQGQDPFPAFAPYQGLAQQYAFAYLQKTKQERRSG